MMRVMSSAWLSSLAKTSVLGTSVRPGKISREQPVPEGADHQPDLVLGDDVPIELVGGVSQVVVELGVPLRAGPAVAVGDEPARLALQGRPLLGDLGTDAVHVEADVYAVGHGLLVTVLHDEVVVEEPDGLLRWRGGQADQEGVEVVQDLPPEVVDRPVALVDDDEIERLDRDLRCCRRPAAAP